MSPPRVIVDPLARPAPGNGEGAPAIGTNKRYAAQLDRRMDERIIQSAIAGQPLQSLTEKELRLEVYPLTTSPQPLEVLAWVRFGPHAMQVRARAVRWTQKAVGIEFEVAGQKHRTWVWANAVDRPGPDQHPGHRTAPDNAPRPGERQPVWQDRPRAAAE